MIIIKSYTCLIYRITITSRGGSDNIFGSKWPQTSRVMKQDFLDNSLTDTGTRKIVRYRKIVARYGTDLRLTHNARSQNKIQMFCLEFSLRFSWLSEFWCNAHIRNSLSPNLKHTIGQQSQLRALWHKVPRFG